MEKSPGRRAVVLAVAAPLVVVATLVGLRSLWATFLLYHLGICLLVPVGLSVLADRIPLRDHLALLGVRGPGQGRAAAAGLLLSVVSGGGVLAIFALRGETLLAGGRIAETLAVWGAAPDRFPQLAAVMVAGNGAAEELFWRGYLHAGLRTWRSRRAAIAVTALGYASYHAVTLSSLVPVTRVVLLFWAAVLGAGLFWGWLRERTGSVWPALLSHAGATAAYMLVCWQRLGS